MVGRNRRVSRNQQPEWNAASLDMSWLMPGDVFVGTDLGGDRLVDRRDGP